MTNHDPTSKSDLIFVLAGREGRKAYGLKLYRAGWAPRLLFSVGRFEIRRFANLALPQQVDLVNLAATIPPPQRHFLVCFSEGGVAVERTQVGKWGTMSEIEALRCWLDRDEQIERVIVVSSWYHVPRLRLCCRTLLNPHLTVEFVPSPEPRIEVLGHHRPDEKRVLPALAEIGKLILYQLVFLRSRLRGRTRAER